MPLIVVSGNVIKHSGCTVDNIPPPPMNGRVTSLSLGAFVNYSCNAGYGFASNATKVVTCDPINQIWMGTPGPCVSNSEFLHECIQF